MLDCTEPLCNLHKICDQSTSKSIISEQDVPRLRKLFKRRHKSCTSLLHRSCHANRQPQCFLCLCELERVTKNIEALDGQMVAKALNSSDNHNPKLAVKSCRKIAHDDPAVSFGMLQDLLRGVASKVFTVSVKGTKSDWILQFMSVVDIPRLHR